MGCRSTEILKQNARGAQENLWPKFILWSAPLRATSSMDPRSSRVAKPKRLKMNVLAPNAKVRISEPKCKFYLVRKALCRTSRFALLAVLQGSLAGFLNNDRVPQALQALSERCERSGRFQASDFRL